MRTPVVVDTNVIWVANGETEQAGPRCVEACVDRLEGIKKTGGLLLDQGGCILEEYPKPKGQPKVGHAFKIWVWTNEYNPERCTRVSIEPDDRRGFAEFPDDNELTNFDRKDRKFVAVAIASGESPPIVNAADPGWWKHRRALARHGVEVDFICPELMKE